MECIDPCVIRTSLKSYDEFISMVQQNNGPYYKYSTVQPVWDGGSHDTDKQKKRDDKKKMNEGKREVWIHFYTVASLNKFLAASFLSPV